MDYNDTFWFSISDLQKVFSAKRIDHSLQYCRTISMMSYGALRARFLRFSLYCDKVNGESSRTVAMQDTIHTVQYHIEHFEPAEEDMFVDELTLFMILSRMRRYTLLPSPADFLKWISKIIIPGVRMEIRLAVLKKITECEDSGTQHAGEVISRDDNVTMPTGTPTEPHPDNCAFINQNALAKSDGIDNEGPLFSGVIHDVGIMDSVNDETAVSPGEQRCDDNDNRRSVEVQNNRSCSIFPESTITSLPTLALPEENNTLTNNVWHSAAQDCFGLSCLSPRNDEKSVDYVNCSIATNSSPAGGTVLFFQGSEMVSPHLENGVDGRESYVDYTYPVSTAVPGENGTCYTDWSAPPQENQHNVDAELDVIMDIISRDIPNAERSEHAQRPYHFYGQSAVMQGADWQTGAEMAPHYADGPEKVAMVSSVSEGGKLYLDPRDAFRLLAVHIDVGDEVETMKHLYDRINLKNEEVVTFWSISRLDFTFYLYDYLLKEISSVPICTKIDEEFFLCEDDEGLIAMINTIICERRSVYSM